MATVACLGELLVDMVSEAADASLADATNFLKAPGGAPANVAVGLARLGVTSSFIGQVGDDPFGHWLRSILEDEQVDVSHLSTSPTARTTIAFVATRRDGRKDICFYRNPGADAALSTQDLPPQLFEGARLFHCGSVTLSQEPAREAQFEAARRAQQQGVLVSFDPNWRPSLWDDHEVARELIWQMMPLCNIAKVADEEWKFVTGFTDYATGAEKIRAQGPQLVIITRGADGAYYNCAGAEGEVAGFAVDAIDSLGAGDAFVAGLLSQILQQQAFAGVLQADVLQKVLRFANACGAIATQKAGAIPALPTREEVEHFLTSR